MKKLLSLSFILSLVFQTSFAQESVNDKAMSLINSDYFHNHKIEKFSLHTNKTVYFAGEKIWFKAYIVEDDSNTPFIEASNVYLNLYDSDFKLVLSNLFYAENGKTYGELKLPDTLKNGNYYLQLDTQWNKNFNRNTIFTIQIVDLTDANAVNINQEILTETIDISTLKTNTNSFEINRTKSNNPKASTFEINAKKEVLQNLNNNYGFAVLHREGSVRSMAPIHFNIDKKSYKINFAKDDMLEGLNTISIFNNKKEELFSKNFFVYEKNAVSLNIIKDTVTEDSLTLSFNFFGSTKIANVSVSVLPEETLVYNNHSNIVSDYLIKPYLKSDRYNTAMRISNYNQEDFDAITQLEAKSNVFVYNTLSDKSTPYASEAGLILNGNVTTKEKDLSKYKVMLSSPENKITAISEIDSQRNFKFDKLLLNHPSKYSLALLNEKGEIENANFYTYSTYVDYRPEKELNINIKTKDLIKKNDSLINLISNQEITNTNFPKYKNIEKLEEVKLEASRYEKEKKLKKRIALDGVFGINFSKIFQPENSGFNTNYLFYYLQILPSSSVIYVYDERRGFTLPVLHNERGSQSINDPAIRPIAIILDGARIEDLSNLEYLPVNDIDYLVLNINGAGYGSLYPFGVLHISSKKGNNRKNIVYKNENIKEFETTFGFIKAEEKYKLPELAFSSQRTIDNFSTIDWIPNFNIKPNSNNLLKINRRDYDNIKLIINGVTEDGKPIYKEHIISLSSN